MLPPRWCEGAARARTRPGPGTGHPTYDGPMAQVERARSAGEQALTSLRRTVSERLADLIRSDPEWAAQAADVGLVDRAWLAACEADPFCHFDARGTASIDRPSATSLAEFPAGRLNGAIARAA